MTRIKVSPANTAELFEVVSIAAVPSETMPSSSGSLQGVDSPSTVESADLQQDVAPPAAEPTMMTPAATKTQKKRRKRRERKNVAVEKETSSFEAQPPTVEPRLKKTKANPSTQGWLLNYVMGNMLTTMDAQVPTTYEQARVRKFWPQ